MSLLLLFNTADIIIGAVAVSEANDAANTSAKLAIAAGVGLTEGSDGIAASGALRITATSSGTDGADTISGQAKLLIQAFAPLAEGSDALGSAGVLSLGGQAGISEADDGSTATAAISITGALSVAEADDTLTAETFQGRAPLLYRKGGDDDWQHHEREKLWKRDLRRIIDEAWRIASGEIDPVTRAEIPPPDLSGVYDALSLLADRRLRDRTKAIIAEEERRAQDEAIALLLAA